MWMGRGGGRRERRGGWLEHAELRQVLLRVCASAVRSPRQHGSRENTYASSPLFLMYSAVLLFVIRNLISAGNQLNVAMVHHSGSIQSFKQQKGWWLVWQSVIYFGAELRCAVTFLPSWIVCGVKCYSEVSDSVLAVSVTQSWRSCTSLSLEMKPVSQPFGFFIHFLMFHWSLRSCTVGSRDQQLTYEWAEQSTKLFKAHLWWYCGWLQLWCCTGRKKYDLSTSFQQCRCWNNSLIFFPFLFLICRNLSCVHSRVWVTFRYLQLE